MQPSNANAAPRCQHIKANGRLCASPALHGQPFCYNHDRAHHPPAHPRKNPIAFIPFLENGQAMVIAITNISRAVCSGELDVAQANTLFKGLRLLKTAFEFRFPMGGDGPEAQALTEGMADALARAYAPTKDAPEAEIAAEPSTSPVETAPYTGHVGTDLPVCTTSHVGPDHSAKPTTSHVGTDLPVCPVERSSTLRTPALPPTSGNRTSPIASSRLPVHSPVRQYRESVPPDDSPSPVGATPSPDDPAEKILPSPLANLPLDAPLTNRQLEYCRFVLRYGPTHPEFNDCTRRLEPETKTRATA